MNSYSRRSALRLGGLSALAASGLAVTTGPSAAAGVMSQPRGHRAVSYRFMVGADNNEGFGNNTLSAFQDADRLMGPLRMRRSFPLLASWGTVVAADKAAGYRSFVSAQVPGGDYDGVAAGKYDAQIASAVRGLPAGTHVTMNHEPENDVPGAVFVKMFRGFYRAVKAANPGVRVGPAHLTYGWRNGTVGNAGNNTGTQAPWEWNVGDAYRDFTAADTYSVTGQALETDPQFRAWYNFFSKVSAKPLGIAEYGQYAVPPGQKRDASLEAQRARLIARDATWLAAQPKFTAMWLVWNGSGAQGNWKLQDRDSIDAWKAAARLGRAK